jgi:23S rRNA pseudouridine955/2504/2580 synthase
MADPQRGMSESLTVEKDEAGIRLDRWFKRRFPALGHGPLEKLLRTGQVRVDGKRAKAADRLASGQTVRIPPQLRQEPESSHKFARETSLSDSDTQFIRNLVIHEDPALFVLNKPSGLATQGGSGISRHIDGLLEGLQGNKRQRPRLVHRLDRDTSGVLLVARTVPAAAALSEALRRRDAQKIYWALTKGVPVPHQGTIRLALAKESGFGEGGRDERMTGVDEDAEGAKAATTHYAVMGTAAFQYAWVALKPVTGRTHQIRAHLSHIGTPIVGDFKYGGADARGMGEIEDRLHLHARSIDIAHPDGGRLSAVAGLPPHMLHSWRLFGFAPDDRSDPFAELRTKRRR